MFIITQDEGGILNFFLKKGGTYQVAQQLTGMDKLFPCLQVMTKFSFIEEVEFVR